MPTDTERMDWFAANPQRLNYTRKSNGPVWSWRSALTGAWSLSVYTDPRAAIDAAIKADATVHTPGGR